jgi:2-keto-4-pentenoate hydratase
MTLIDGHAIAREIIGAYADRRPIPPFTSRPHALSLAGAYEIEGELARLRIASGARIVGRKVGYANKAVWRVLKLETLVWASMYDDTVRHAPANEASLSIDRMLSPKIEPEIVFKMKRPLDDRDADANSVLGAIEWMALGFEIIDCPYIDWKFQPADFVAAYGLHAALIVGEPCPIEPASIPAIADALPRCTVSLLRDGTLVEEGSGKNSLRSPALCVRELASASAKQAGASPLGAGELVSTGTLTESQPISQGQTWTAVVEGLNVPGLAVKVM